MTTPVPRGITESDIWRAADALLLEGARPTIERVRHKIGRGSPNTVSPHLETWFRSLGARIADPQAFAAPPALPTPISQAAQHFWEAALTAARAEGAALLDAARAEISEAHRELAAERARLDTERQRLAVQSRANEEILEGLRAQLNDVQQRLAASTTQVSERALEVTGLRGELTRLTHDREATRQQSHADRAAFDAYRNDMEARETAHTTHWAAQVDRARETTKSLQSQFSQFEKDSATRVEELRRSVQALEHERAILAEQNNRWQTDLSRLSAARDAELKTQADGQTRSQARELQLVAQCERMQAQLTDTLAQLAAKDREHGELLRSLLANANNAGRPRRVQERKP